MLNRFERTPLAAAVVLAFSGSALAQSQTQQSLPEVRVTAPSDSYRAERAASPKFAAPLLDTPQTVTVVPAQMIEEQGALSLRDVLRNVTGISIQAGEGNPPMGDQLKLRGFSARNDFYVDGAYEAGMYFRDPFNLERLEVVKGPASAYAGRGSVAGYINMVTKSPRLEPFTEGTVSLGTDATKRATLDYNRPLELGTGAALRLNAMVHDAEVEGRDHVFNKRWGFAPSVAFGLGTATRITLSLQHVEQDNLPDYGIPTTRNASLRGSGFEGKVAPVAYSNFYGLLNRDYENVTADLATFRFEHDFGRAATLQNQLRYGRVHTDAIVSAPRLNGNGIPNPTTLTPASLVTRSGKPRDQVDTVLVNQTDITVRLGAGAVEHTVVAGVEVAMHESENKRRRDPSGPNTSLFNPDPNQPITGAALALYDGTRAIAETGSVGVYVSDTVKLSERWQLTGGLRWDRVSTEFRGIDDSGANPGFVSNLDRTDAARSGRFGAVYKPAANGSIYAGYGTSFNPTASTDVVHLAGGGATPNTNAGGFDVGPEKTRSWELGTKWDLFGNRTQVAAAAFRIDKTNARTPGLAGQPPTVLDGEQQVDGLELSAAGSLTAAWSVFAGYTHLDGKVVSSNTPGQTGKDLDNTPRHTLSLWTTYHFPSRLAVGGGAQFVDSRTNLIDSGTGTVPITVDSYTRFDAMASYPVHRNAVLQLNVFNLTDEKYIEQLGGGQAVPGPGRSALVSAKFSF